MKTEKRQQLRYDKRESVSIEVLSATSRAKKNNHVLECSTQDISMNGLKVHSKFPFIKGAILDLLVSFKSGGYQFLLTGKVKWFERIADGEYLAGFELIESEHSDFTAWQGIFSEETSP